MPFADDNFAESFSELDLKFAQISGKEFEACTFCACDFTQAQIKASIFSGCRFRNCDFTLATLTDTKNFQIDIRNNTLTGAKFSRYDALRLLEGLGIELRD